jgi:hypothetical protein
MFFYIGKNCPIKSVEQKADNIFLDKGWKQTTIQGINYWYKGYSTDCILSENINEIVKGYKPGGKWAVISGTGDIYYPKLRGFPVYTNTELVKTNIPLDNYSNAYYDTFIFDRPESKISLEEASSEINNILQENIKNFFKYNKIDKLRVLFSAGIDTLSLWAVLDNLEFDYDLYIHLPKLNNIFGVKQEYDSDLIDICRKKFWGYKMTSCYSDENYYLTGFYSERLQLREVTQGHTIANYKNKKLHELPKKTDYLYWFLQRPVTKVNNEPRFTTEKEVIDWCNKSVFYDHQMWHIDNNYHFSPFYDLRITQVINKLSLEDIVTNAFNATIQKNIIKYNRPDFLSILSDYKNERNIWGNYNKNFHKIVLRDTINKFIT